jgi:hypothetical protein
MKFSIEGQIPPMAKGATIDYRVRVGPLPVRWRTRITRWEPGRSFVKRVFQYRGDVIRLRFGVS